MVLESDLRARYSVLRISLCLVYYAWYAWAHCKSDNRVGIGEFVKQRHFYTR
jgi:hypothetical protein